MKIHCGDTLTPYSNSSRRDESIGGVEGSQNRKLKSHDADNDDDNDDDDDDDDVSRFGLDGVAPVFIFGTPGPHQSTCLGESCSNLVSSAPQRSHGAHIRVIYDPIYDPHISLYGLI